MLLKLESNLTRIIIKNRVISHFSNYNIAIVEINRIINKEPLELPDKELPELLNNLNNNLNNKSNNRFNKFNKFNKFNSKDL